MKESDEVDILGMGELEMLAKDSLDIPSMTFQAREVKHDTYGDVEFFGKASELWNLYGYAL